MLWSLIIVAKLGVGVMLLTADGTEDTDWFRRMDGMSKVLAALEGVSFVLTAALVQQDLLVGTKAFWVTRPISGGRLLRAKLWFIGLVFLILPLLLTLPWWLGCGYGLREIGWAAMETTLIHAGCVLLGLLWAVVTDGFARFLMWTIVTLFAVPTLIGTLNYYMWRGGARLSGDVMGERMLVGALIAVTAILAVVVHQYLTRKTSRSIGLIGAAAGLIIVVGVWWPGYLKLESRVYSYLIRQAQGEWPVNAEPAGLNFVVTSAKLTLQPPARTNGGTLKVSYNVTGLSDTQGLMPVYSEHSLSWPDGTKEDGRTYSRSDMSIFAVEGSLAVALKMVPREGQYTDSINAVSALNKVSGEIMQAMPPAYTLRARLRLMRFESATPVPQTSGDRNLHGVMGERITAVEKSGENLLVSFVRHYPSLLVDNVGGGPLAPVGQYVQYYLVNRARDFVGRGEAISRRSTRVGTVNIDWYTMSYPGARRGKQTKLDAINALNDAELMKVTFVEQARFTHEIKVDPFKVELVNP